MKQIFTALLFMFLVVGFVTVGFTANAYNSIQEIKLDGDDAINKTTTLLLEFESVSVDSYRFQDSSYNAIYFEKSDKFKETIKKIIKSKESGDSMASYNRAYAHIQYHVTFKIIRFEGNSIVGDIIKITDSEKKEIK